MPNRPHLQSMPFFSLQNRRNFLCFQASRGKCEVSAERESRDRLDANFFRVLIPSRVTRSPRSPRASRLPSRSPAKRKNITPVLQASPFPAKFHYLSSVNQAPGVQKSKSVLMTVVVPRSVCIVIIVIHIMLKTQGQQCTSNWSSLRK